MNRRTFQFMVGAGWLALPLIALRYWQVWDQLPLRMATHFDVNSHPNGWMSRETSLWFALGISAFLLIISTVVLLVRYSAAHADAASWAVLAFFYFILGFVFVGNERVIAYNLNRSPVQIGIGLLAVPLAMVVLLAVLLATKRGQPLSPEPWVAQETHASPFIAMLFLLPLFIEFWLLSVVPPGPAHLGIGLFCLLFVALAVFAATGFRYYFGDAGVEIRALGYRLRSIPAAQITSYSIEPWNLARGYGIRGVGATRAYVWGNHVVHIKTPQGEIFLGHNQPEKIMRDLDLITHKRTSGTAL